MPPLKKREENIRLLKLAAEGKLTPDDLIKQEPGFRIWLNLNNGNEMYIGDMPGGKPPPKSPRPAYKITLNLSK